MTGLFGDYLENRLRVSGENLDLWSAAKIERHRNDEGELSVFSEGYTSLAESLGLYSPQEHVDTVSKPLDAAINAVRAKYDLADDDQDRQPFGRVQTAEGYIAQGLRRAIVTTRKTSEKRKYSDYPMAETRPMICSTASLRSQSRFWHDSSCKTYGCLTNWSPPHLPKRAIPFTDFAGFRSILFAAA